jgi:BRCT domain type II-containing protein
MAGPKGEVADAATVAGAGTTMLDLHRLPRCRHLPAHRRQSASTTVTSSSSSTTPRTCLAERNSQKSLRSFSLAESWWP